MPDVIYEIVQHDGGWAYKVDGVFSEPFATHAEALAAAQAAAEEQEVPGNTEKSSTKMTRASGTRKPPVAETDHTPPSRTLTEERERLEQEEALDEALKNTFPASDPVSAEQP